MGLTGPPDLKLAGALSVAAGTLLGFSATLLIALAIYVLAMLMVPKMRTLNAAFRNC